MCPSGFFRSESHSTGSSWVVVRYAGPRSCGSSSTWTPSSIRSFTPSPTKISGKLRDGSSVVGDNNDVADGLDICIGVNVVGQLLIDRFIDLSFNWHCWRDDRPHVNGLDLLIERSADTLPVVVKFCRKEKLENHSGLRVTVTFSPIHILSLALSLTHAHSRSLTLTHAHSLSLSRTHSHSLTLTLTHSNRAALTQRSWRDLRFQHAI